MAYTKSRDDWQDLEVGATPILAENLDHIEDGIVDAAANADTAVADAATGIADAATAQAAADAAQTAANNALARANHTGTQSADTVIDGATNHVFTAADDTKLGGIATGATANDTDANLRARASHTGTQDADTITDGTTNKAYTAVEKTKLAGIETAATADQTAAELLTAIKTVDGTGSGLDADLLDGVDATAFVRDTGNESIAGIKTFTDDPIIPAEAYGAGWNGVNEPPTKNDTYDEMELRATKISPTFTGTAPIIPDAAGATQAINRQTGDARYAPKATFPVLIGVALSDETTAIVAGNGKCTIHAPFAFTLTSVKAEVNTVSSSGVITVDINEGVGAGTSVLSTKLTIDASEETSNTAATAAVISDSSIADDGRLTFDIDGAGTGAKGLKVWLYGTRVLP